MTGSGLLLELVLIGLLAATLFHAVRLERALGVLKRDRAVLEGLVSGFNAATRQAEAGIDRLRGAVDGAGRQVAKQIDFGTSLKDDLQFLIERGERLADRLDPLVRQHPSDSLVRQHPSDAPARQHLLDSPVRQHPLDTMLRQHPLDTMLRQQRPDSAIPPREPTAERDPPLRPVALDDTAPRVRSQAERDLLRALRAAR